MTQKNETTDAPLNAQATVDHELLVGLSDAERHATRLLKTILDCFNYRDGLGLLEGPARYTVLEGRVSLAANASRTLFEFYSILSKKMLWPIPPMRVDGLILPLLAGLDEGHDRRVVNVLRRETQSLIMLARTWHAEDRDVRRRAKAELDAEWQAVLDTSANAPTDSPVDADERRAGESPSAPTLTGAGS